MTPELPRIETDPEILAAAAEVDRSLLAWFGSLSPDERLQYAARQARLLSEARAAGKR